LRAWLGEVKNDEQPAARWKHTIHAIGLLAVAVLLLSLLLPRLRVAAILLAVFAVVAMLGVLPRLRAMNWRHWFSGLVVVLVLVLLLSAFGPFSPFGAWGLAPVWSRPMLASVSDWVLPTTTGTVRRFTLTPIGELDGLILEEGTEVHVPPHLSPQLAAAIRLGDSVTVRGYRTWFEPVVRAVSITDAATAGIVIDAGPPPPGFGPRRSLRASTAVMQPMSVEGRFDRWLHGPAGDVNGAMLADGTILRFSPSLAYRLEGVLEPGQTIRADGLGTATAYGTVVVVQTFGIAAAIPAQSSGKGAIAPAAPS
jgi:hypothetical protein